MWKLLALTVTLLSCCWLNKNLDAKIYPKNWSIFCTIEIKLLYSVISKWVVTQLKQKVIYLNCGHLHCNAMYVIHICFVKIISCGSIYWFLLSDCYFCLQYDLVVSLLQLPCLNLIPLFTVWVCCAAISHRGAHHVVVTSYTDALVFTTIR